MLGAARGKRRKSIPTVKHPVVSRERFGELLKYALTKPLTVVSAPAGYGKTLAVLSQLPELDDFSCVWLNITQKMNDAQQFVDAFSDGVAEQLLEPSISLRLASKLRLQEGNTPKHRLQSLFDLIESYSSPSGRNPPNVLLVLDDYQCIEEKAVHKLLSYLIDELPIFIRVLVISRNRPPLAEKYLNSSSECTYLTQEHCQFDFHETVEFVQHSLQVQLNEEQIHLIHQQTQGWPSGIQLIAIQWQLSVTNQSGTLDISNFAEVTAHVFENHVLTQLSPEICKVILELAHLQFFSQDMVNHIYGEELGARVISCIEQQNLFYSRSGHGNASYRFRDLFKEFLISKRETDKNFILNQAARWYLNQNDFHMAIHYFIEGQAFEKAAVVINRHGDQFYRRGEFHAIKTWLDALPSEVKTTYPKLLILSCWSISDVEKPALCPMILEQLDRLLADEEKKPGFVETDEWRQLKVDYLLIKAFIDLVCSEFVVSVECAKSVINQIQEYSLLGAARAYLILGQNRYFLGEHTQAMLDLERTIHLAKQEKNPYVMIIGLAYLVFVYTIAGKIEESVQVGEEVRQWLEDNGFGDLALAKASLSILSVTYREKNQLDKTFEVLGTGLSYCQGDVPIFQQIAMNLSYFRYLISVQDYEKALEVVERISELTPRVVFKGKRSLWTFAQPSSDILRCAVFAAQGRGDEIRFVLSQLKQKLAPLDEFIYEPEKVLLARLLLSVGDIEGALQITAAVKVQAAKQNRVLHLLQCQLIEAVAWYYTDREQEAMDQFVQVLERGIHCGFRRLFLDAEVILEPLMKKAQEIPGVQACVELLRRSEFDSNSSSLREKSDAQLKLTLLTRRELAVIELLANGDSNKKIAQQLNIAPETVKKFVNNILKKLKMRNRTEAALFYNNSL